VSAPEIHDNDVNRGRELAVLIGTFLISFAAFAVGFGSWKFGLGFVLLLLVHELGHVFAARWQGVDVSLPTFVPFFGAYVMVRHAGLPPWRSAVISLAGPFLGGLGATAAWAVGEAHDSHWLVVLAYIGFLLNAANLLPVGILDGGGVVRGISQSRRGWIRFENGVPVEAVPADQEHANLVTVLYVLLAAALVAGVLATRHSAML
jgi:membrane-associated protease RseP (regulator of RpoE activity)